MPAPTTSSAGRADALAPGHPTETRFCVYRSDGRRARSERVYPGGPLDRVLNGSVVRFPPRIACAGTATLPTVVVLGYRNAPTRRVVVDVGGCDLTTADHTHRVLLDTGLLLGYYVNASRR